MRSDAKTQVAPTAATDEFAWHLHIHYGGIEGLEREALRALWKHWLRQFVEWRDKTTDDTVQGLLDKEIKKVQLRLDPAMIRRVKTRERVRRFRARKAEAQGLGEA